MNKVFIKSKNSLKLFYKYLLLALMPLLLYGFYKNGIFLYINKYTSFIGLFKPIIFDLLGFLIGLIVNLIYTKNKKIYHNLNDTLYNSFAPIYGLLIASLVSINTNIFLFIIITFFILLISRFTGKHNINVVSLSVLIIILITNLIGNFSYLNNYELAKNLNLNGIDYLFGRGSGGINTTSGILLIISLIILSTKPFYKKEIPLYSSLIYIILIIGYDIITNNVGYILDNIFANGILFSFVFVGTDPLTSSYTKKGMFIYSLIIGIITFILYLIYPPLSSLGGILIASLSHDIIDKMLEKS
jgi:Na+-translocating ferredoxin:NAD+ oxidoreductase RnfD subunit